MAEQKTPEQILEEAEANEKLAQAKMKIAKLMEDENELTIAELRLIDEKIAKYEALMLVNG